MYNKEIAEQASYTQLASLKLTEAGFDLIEGRSLTEANNLKTYVKRFPTDKHPPVLYSGYQYMVKATIKALPFPKNGEPVSVDLSVQTIVPLNDPNGKTNLQRSTLQITGLLLANLDKVAETAESMVEGLRSMETALLTQEAAVLDV